MKVASYGDSLEACLRDLSPAAPEGTPLFQAGREALEMAGAYLNDGRTFLAAGDAMNGLAAFTYASGWLDASSVQGLFSEERVLGLPDFSMDSGSLGGDRIREKRERYRRMLAGALEALEASPDPGSPLLPAATMVLGRAGEFLAAGDIHAGRGDQGNALACYSHGHGWLDAGIRAGLLRILHSRELFTVGPL